MGLVSWFKGFLGMGEAPAAPMVPEGYQPVARATILSSVPALHPSVERVADKRYGCTLQWELTPEQLAASRRGRRLSRLFFNPSRPRLHKLVLDDMGRRTVELIDGNRTVADIASEMAASVGCDRKQMEEAVLAFASQLARRNAVTLAPKRI